MTVNGYTETRSPLGLRWLIKKDEIKGTRVAIHIPSGKTYGKIANGHNSEIRQVMAATFIVNCTVLPIFRIFLRTLYLLSGHWCWAVAYQKALKSWEIERFQHIQEGKPIESSPTHLHLCRKVALYSLKYFADCSIKLITQPIATALSILANLTAIIDPLASRHFYYSIDEIWEINYQHPKFLWKDKTQLNFFFYLNHTFVCMVPSSVLKKFDYYASYTKKQLEMRSQLHQFTRLINENSGYFTKTTSESLSKIRREINTIIKEKCLNSSHDFIWDNYGITELIENKSFKEINVYNLLSEESNFLKILYTYYVRKSLKKINETLTDHLNEVVNFTNKKIEGHSLQKPDDYIIELNSIYNRLIEEIEGSPEEVRSWDLGRVLVGPNS